MTFGSKASLPVARKRQKFAGAFALVLVSLVVAACGSSSSPKSSATSSTSNASTSNASASNAGASSSSASGSSQSPTASGTPAEVQALLDGNYGSGVTASQLPATAQAAIKLYAAPATSTEDALIEKCLKTTGPCTIHSSGTINVAESEDANDPYYDQIRAMDILMAARIPQVKTLTYTNANFSLPTALSNFRTHISQGANVIVGGFNFGAAMLPVIKQAAAKHITVWAADTPVPGATLNGTDLGGEVEANVCNFGKTGAQAALKAGKQIAMYTGQAGNSYAGRWQPCAKAAIASGGGSIVENGYTSWTPQGTQQAAAALAAKGLPSAILYDYDPTAFITKFVSLGKTPPTIVCDTTIGGYAAWKAAAKAGHAFKAYSHSSELILSPVALYAAVEQHLGKSVDKDINFPEKVAPLQDWSRFYAASSSLASGASFGSGLSNDVQQAAFSAGS